MRTITSMIKFLIVGFSLAQFTQTTLAIINNMQPSFTLMFGSLILSEQVNCTDIIQGIISLSAVGLIVFSMIEHQNPSQFKDD